MLVRQVIPPRAPVLLEDQLFSVVRAAVCGAAIGLLLSRAIWSPAVNPVERVKLLEVPSLCENSRGVWQRCPWVRERNPARIETRPTVSRWERR